MVQFSTFSIKLII